jgi:adenylylsulfate kinase
LEDRLEQARRMGALARLLSNQGYSVVVDFVCPTEQTREAFGHADRIIWMSRIEKGRFEDTNILWQDPIKYDLKINDKLTVEQELDYVIYKFGLFSWKEPTTLMLGRYQPWHEGHSALYREGHLRTSQVVIGVRDTYLTSEKDPLTFDQVKDNILSSENNSFIIKMPNITNIIYGRDVGYKIEKIDLSPEIESISATQKRKELGI